MFVLFGRFANDFSDVVFRRNGLAAWMTPQAADGHLLVPVVPRFCRGADIDFRAKLTLLLVKNRFACLTSSTLEEG